MPGVAPLCFFPRIFEIWESTPVAAQDRARCTPCTDCMPSYQLRMKKLGRCEYPNTMFSFDEDGGVVGHRA
jgi:hypothetical protein